MKKSKEVEYRMYGLVPYNLSPIQQGIQFGHAVVEYAEKYFKTKEYRKWATQDKTFIILNGGTTNKGKARIGGLLGEGSLNKSSRSLEYMGVKIAHFNEPDLQDALTAVVFLVPDYVWDKKTYPETSANIKHPSNWKEHVLAKEQRTIEFLRNYLEKFKLA